MTRSWMIGLALVTACPLAAAADKPPTRPADDPAERMGFRLGMQAWSFHSYSFFEAIDKTAELGLHYIEAYPGQILSKETGTARMDHNLSAELRKKVKAKLADAGVTLVNYGVVGLGGEASARKVFEFAKDMGIETIVSEPEPAAMPMLDKLCAEYGVNVALHNHPKPSRYWNPDTVLDACKGLSKRVGACADTGHWMRSDVKPIEALRKLEGRIVSLHFKDLDRFGGGAHDVPWGTGAGDVKAMLAELQRQKLRAVFSIEYEYHWTSSMPEIAKCVAYFRQVAAALAAEATSGPSAPAP